MTKQSAPLVTCDLIGSDQWQEWLDAHDKFKFENGCYKFTAYKSKTGHWSAQRRMHGRLRHQYLGKSQDMTDEKLQAVAERLGIISETAYETGLKATLRKADKELLADTSAIAKSHKTESDDYETKRSLTSQATEEIAELKSKLEQVTQDRDNLLIRLGNLKIQAHEDAKIRIDQLEKRVAELDDANWEMQKQYTVVDELAQRRDRQLHELRVECERLKTIDLKSLNEEKAKIYQLRGEAVIHVKYLEALGYTVR